MTDSILECTQEQLEKVACENRRLVDINQKLERELKRYKTTFGDIDVVGKPRRTR